MLHTLRPGPGREHSLTDSTAVPADGAVDLSVVLVTWNSLEVTAAALESLRRHTKGVTYEVFVIDNGTTRDATVTELPRRFPWVRFLANPDNRGFTRANNQGIRLSRGRYVLLLNSDTLQTENALGKAVRYLDARPEVGALGILHHNHDADRSFQPSFAEFPRPLADTLGMLGWGRPRRTPEVREQDVDWVCGSFLLIRRACLEQVGPLDERFFSYDEDIDWCLRARRAGWIVRFWPGTSLIHLGGAATPHLRDKTFMMFRSHLTYLAKHHGRAAAAAFYLALAFMLCLATLKQLLRLLVGRGRWADVQGRGRRLVHFVTRRPGNIGG